MKIILVKRLFIIFFPFIFLSCSTIAVRKFSPPPSFNRLETLKKAIDSSSVFGETQNESEELAKSYLLAKKAEKDGHLNIACHFFTDLAQNNNFTIKDAALVHRLETCNLSENELLQIWEANTKRNDLPRYLTEAYFEQSLKQAIKKNLLTFEAQFSFDLISFRSIQAEKIKLLTRSIAIAEQLKDDQKIKIYNQRLKELSPSRLNDDEITNQNIYSIARDFESNRKFDQARKLYQQIISGEFIIKDKVKAYNALRTSYKIERNPKVFLLKTFEMEAFLNKEMTTHPDDKKTIDYWVDSKIDLTKAIWTAHQSTEAKHALDDLIKTKLGNTNQLATIQLIYGSLYLEKKENQQALDFFEKAIKFKVTDNALRENIQWAIFWNNYLLKRDDRAITYAESFIKQSNNPNFILKLNYWKAKILMRLSKTQEAHDLWTSINTTDPFGYYGIISAIELNIQLPPILSSQMTTQPTGRHILDWLIAMEEKSFSQKYLQEINSQFKTTTERESAMPLYYQTEWYQGGMRQIYTFGKNTINAMTEKYINVMFPIPYIDSVNRLAQKYTVPKELIYAIARQESVFVPNERSGADAFGLMQIIPEKALELSKRYGIPYNSYNDLYNPEINLEMGTALLKNLREKFNYHFLQSTAAYNANANLIPIWEKERFNGNYFEFIEMIPYEETRNYIKLVFRNYITYKRIMSKESFVIDKDFFARSF